MSGHGRGWNGMSLGVHPSETIQMISPDLSFIELNHRAYFFKDGIKESFDKALGTNFPFMSVLLSFL